MYGHLVIKNLNMVSTYSFCGIYTVLSAVFVTHIQVIGPWSFQIVVSFSVLNGHALVKRIFVKYTTFQALSKVKTLGIQIMCGCDEHVGHNSYRLNIFDCYPMHFKHGNTHYIPSSLYFAATLSSKTWTWSRHTVFAKYTQSFQLYLQHMYKLLGRDHFSLR